MDHRGAISDPTLLEFTLLIKDHLGLNYETDHQKKDLEAKLLPISQAFGCRTPTECLALLKKAPLSKDQIKTLAQYLTIGETYFFRDKNLFGVLEDRILPKLIAAKSGRDQQLRIWSAACCTGEEPYSIAILLHKLIPNLSEWRISILATDINPAFLEKAEAGVYGEWSFRSMPVKLRAKYFTDQGQHKYRIDPKIQELVTFKILNLIEDTYPSLTNETNGMDLIFCNNVLIYFSEATIAQVIKQLASSLVENGWLFVSAVEVPLIHDSRLTTRFFDDAHLFQKSPSSADHGKPIVKQSPPKEPVKQPASPPKRSCIDALNALLKIGEYQRLVVELEKQLESFAKHPEKNAELIDEAILLTKAYANQGQLQQARFWCEHAIAANKLDPLFYLLHASILEELSLKEEAVQAVRKSLFLDQNLAMAHFQLAHLLQLAGASDESQKCYRNTLNLLKKMSEEELLPGADGMTAGRLSEIIKAIHQGIRAHDD